MKRIVVVSAHLPSPDANQAGDKTSFRVLEWLAGRWALHFVGMSAQDEGTTLRYTERLTALCQTVDVVRVTARTRVAGLLRHPRLPVRVAVRSMPSLRRRLVELSDGAAVILFDHTQMLQYLAPDGCAAPRRLALAHDVLFQGAQREAQREKRRLLRRWRARESERLKRWELAALRRCDTVVVQAEKDRDLLLREAPLTVRVMPPYVDATWASECQRYPDEAAPACLFWGAMNRTENVDAVRGFVRSILPLVRRSVPEVRLWVVGGRPHADIQRLGREDAAVRVTGFVADPRPYFERSSVSVAPLRLGAGIKVKVLESMLAGLPVVGTDVAAEGIDASASDGLFVERTAAAFADRVVELLLDPRRAAALGRRARAYVGARFSWDQSTRILEDVLAPPA
jgi:hypothetical protein